jgi:hypothetical protein
MTSVLNADVCALMTVIFLPSNRSSSLLQSPVISWPSSSEDVMKHLLPLSISCSPLRMRNTSDESSRENRNTYFMLNNVLFYPRKSCHLWDHVEKYGTAGQATDDDITRRIRFGFWVNNVTNTHSEYEILIASLQQKRLHERASIWALHVSLITRSNLCMSLG